MMLTVRSSSRSLQHGNGCDPRGQHRQWAGAAVGPADPGECVDPRTQEGIPVTAGADGVSPVDGVNQA